MRYNVSITSSYGHLSRYAFMVECECLDGDGERCGFFKSGNGDAVIGTSFSAGFSTCECASVNLFLFVVPLSLPDEREVAANATFPVCISMDDGASRPRIIDVNVNVWSGTNFSVSIPE